MQLEAGKYYMTRDGRKVGPIEYNAGGGRGKNGENYPFSSKEHTFTENGRKGWDTLIDHPCDLITEWQDAPAIPTNDPSHASDAAKYGICITVTVGDISVTYDGRAK